MKETHSNNGKITQKMYKLKKSPMLLEVEPEKIANIYEYYNMQSACWTTMNCFHSSHYFAQKS